jgi:hypothetical protein
MMERRSSVSKELRYWQSEREWPLGKRVAFALMLLILVVGLLAVWSVDGQQQHADYWDAHGCINHLDGSVYNGTADKLSEFPKQDVCKEYVHIKY